MPWLTILVRPWAVRAGAHLVVPGSMRSDLPLPHLVEAVGTVEVFTPAQHDTGWTGALAD
jgi:hypothetical protein